MDVIITMQSWQPSGYSQFSFSTGTLDDRTKELGGLVLSLLRYGDLIHHMGFSTLAGVVTMRVGGQPSHENWSMQSFLM